ERVSGARFGHCARADCDQPRHSGHCGRLGENRSCKALSGTDPLQRCGIVDSTVSSQLPGRLRKPIMTIVVLWLFWSAVALIGYVFVGYPILLAICSVIWPRRCRSP